MTEARFANGKLPKATPDFNRGNHYGGRWSAAKEHPGWNHAGVHVWRHRRYCWYDDGWLILDDDFGPDDYTYYAQDYEDEPVSTGPLSFTSLALRVQSKLAEEGYYPGRVDGRMGPEFRKAIEKYQGDHGLKITGLVDAPLVESLDVD